MHRSARASLAVLCFSVALLLASAPDAGAQTDARTCRLKTKSMGCSLESGLSALEAVGRAVGAAATIPAEAGMKCEVDTPAITPVKVEGVYSDPPCDDGEPADDSDFVIDLCKSASTQVFARCKAVCAKFRKRDSTTGDPLPGIACRVIVDRSMVSTTITRFTGFTNNGEPKCSARCEASVLCVCDP